MNLTSGPSLASASTSSAPSAALVLLAGPPPATASTGEFAQVLGALEPGLNALEPGLNALAMPAPVLPEASPSGGAELPGGKILPLAGVALAPQPEFPAGSDAALPEVATNDLTAPEYPAGHGAAAGNAGAEQEAELPTSSEAVKSLVDQVSAPALVLGASPVKAEPALAEPRLPLAHPPAVGLRARSAPGESLPRGIEVAGSVHAQRATLREAVMALLEQPGSGALPADAAGSARGAEAAPPQVARAEVPGMTGSALPVAANTFSQPVITSLPTAAAQIETLIDKLFAARENGQLARGEVLLRHAEFGAVALQLDQTTSDWRATLSSRDPGFAPAAQAALAERAVLASSDTSGGSSRGAESPGSQSGGARDPGGMASGDQRASHGRTGQHFTADLQPTFTRRSDDPAASDEPAISTVAVPARGQFA